MNLNSSLFGSQSSTSQPSTPQPSTHTLNMNIHNVIAAWNKINYNYPPETRTAAIRKLFCEMSPENLGNYTVASASQNSVRSSYHAAKSFFSNTFKRRGGRKKNRGSRTRKMR